MRRFVMSGLTALLLMWCSGAISAQKKNEPDDPKNIEQGRQLLQSVIEARGGTAYLSFKTLLATGQFTPYDKGISTVPQPFIDYLIYPDRERLEFGKGKKKDRNIQVNSGQTGWIYDGEAETLKDQDEKQLKNFQDGLRFDPDRILRGGWQQAKKIWFYGREETRPGERADVVALELEQGNQVLLVIDPYSKLPLKLVYEKNEEKGISRHEVRFFQYVVYDGVKFPNIVDFFRDGIQTARVNYNEIKIGVPVPEELFAKPASTKAIK